MKKTSHNLTRKQKMRTMAVARGDYPTSPDMDKLGGSIETLRGTIDELIQDIKAGRPVDPDAVNSVYKLSNSLSGLARARTEIEKVKMEGFQVYRLAGESILHGIRDLLSEYPELDTQIQTLVERAAFEAQAKGDTL